MACINADNTLTETAKNIIRTLMAGATEEDVAKSLYLPLFKIRSSIRELSKAGYIEEMGSALIITEKGKEVLNK